MDHLKGVVPPKQQRSRERVERILRAADELMAQRPFQDITVQDLCIAADVSPSSFYARFPRREDVLLALFELHAADIRRDAAEAAGEVIARSGTLAEVTRLILEAYLRFVRANGPLMTSIFSDPLLNERYYALSSEIYDELAELLSALYGAGGRQFRLRAEFAARSATACILRAVGVPTHFGERMGITDDQLLDELTALVLPYLEAATRESAPRLD